MMEDMDKKFFSVITERYEITDKGKPMKKREYYLIYAYTLTEAESVAIEKYCDNDETFRVVEAKITKIIDVVL